MLVYSRRQYSEARPSWIIGTRLLTFAVTTAVAWPHRNESPILISLLLVYAFFTALTVLSLLLGRRWRLLLLPSTSQILQIVSELAVISLVVFETGGISSPSSSLYLMTIVSATLTYRLVGTLLVAALASAAFVTSVWVEAGYHAGTLWSSDVLGALGRLSDESFYTMFLRLCMFFLCAFAGGYLAERLYSKGEALEYTSEALKIAKLETGDILKHLRSGVLTIDAAGHVVYFNRAAEEILAISEKKVRGRPIREALGAVYPIFTERLEWVLQSQQTDHRTELTIIRPDGHALPMGLSTSVLSGSNGRPRGVVAVFADLSDAKEIEERMRRQDRLAAIGELSAGIAHEIRNPLAAISGSVEVLRSELELSGENARLFELIVKESSRLNKILSDFLLYARMSPVVTGRVRVSTVLDEVMEIIRRHFRQVGTLNLELRSDIADRTLTVEADADHLKQILINLIFNGVEASQPDHAAVTVRVRTADSPDSSINLDAPSGGEWAMISVVDRGAGIPDKIRGRLYEPFVSTKPHGTGLGLAIVKRLVDNCGGRLSVESHVGEGTTFSIFLRRCPSTVAESRIPARSVAI